MKDSLLAQLRPHLTFNSYEAGATIAARLGEPRGLYFIDTGAAVLEFQHANGERLSLLRQPGQFVGVESLFVERAGPVMCLKALSDISVGHISSEGINKLLHGPLAGSLPQMVDALTTELATALQDIYTSMEEVTLSSSQVRIANTLKRLAVVQGEGHEQGVVVSVQIDTLAQMSGVSKETARRGVEHLIRTGKAAKTGKTTYLLFK